MGVGNATALFVQVRFFLALSLSPILASAGRFLSYLSSWLPSTPSVFPSRRTLLPSQVCLLGEGTLLPKRTGCEWNSSPSLSPPCFLFSSSLPIPADRNLLCSLVWSPFNASVYLRQPPYCWFSCLASHPSYFSQVIKKKKNLLLVCELAMSP